MGAGVAAATLLLRASDCFVNIVYFFLRRAERERGEKDSDEKRILMYNEWASCRARSLFFLCVMRMHACTSWEQKLMV